MTESYRSKVDATKYQRFKLNCVRSNMPDGVNTLCLSSKSIVCIAGWSNAARHGVKKTSVLGEESTNSAGSRTWSVAIERHPPSFLHSWWGRTPMREGR